MIRLFIADDHMIMREGLKQLFALEKDITVVAEAARGEAVIDNLGHQDVDLLLLDMSMPGFGGKELVVYLQAHHPELPILVLSMYNEPQIARQALRAGAAGYLSKDRDPEMLLAAIRKVACGGRFLDPQIAESMAFEIQDNGRSRPSLECLTKRETQVFRMLAQGCGVGEIATHLQISNKTVSTHKANLMEKMGFASSVDLYRYALVHGVI